MKFRASGWLQALALAGSLSTAACSDDKPTPPASCSPACSSGYTCTMGVCAALCNPPCGAGETCVVRGGATTCAAGVADAGADAPDDLPATPDLPGLDTPPGMDTPPVDQPAAPDVPAADVMRAPCGMTGQPCCGFDPSNPSSTGSCVGNNLCDQSARRCVAYTPEANECTSTGACPTGQVCTYGELCSGGTRACLRCLPRVAMGALPAGAPCGGMVAAPCADGLCINSRCTRGCPLGAAGDAACQAAIPGTVCGEVTYSVPVDGGFSPPVAFGACIRSCRRDADCMDAAGNLRCGLSMRRFDDTLLQTCRVTSATLSPGASCPLMPTPRTDPAMYCQSGQCFSIPMNTMTGFCSAYCVTDADCPANARFCRDIPFIRPGGMTSPTQPIRMCERM